MPRKRPTEPPPLRVHPSSDPDLIIEERDPSTWWPKPRGWHKEYDATDRDFQVLERLYDALLGTCPADKRIATRILNQSTSDLRAAQLCVMLGIEDPDRTLRRRMPEIRKKYREFEAARAAAL